MSTKNYLLIAVLSLVVLCPDSFALYVDSQVTLGWNEAPWIYVDIGGAYVYVKRFKTERWEDHGEGVGVTRIVNGGKLIIDGTDAGMDGVGWPQYNPAVAPSQIIVDNGGVFEMLNNTMKLGDNWGPVFPEMDGFLVNNGGSAYLRRIELRVNTVESPRGCFLYVAAGGYLYCRSGIGQFDAQDPASWLYANGLPSCKSPIFFAEEGYDLLVTDLGQDPNVPINMGRSWKAEAVASTLNPIPADGDPVFTFTLTSLKWNNHRHADGFKVWFGTADCGLTDYDQTGKLTQIGTTGALTTNGSQVTYPVPVAYQTLAPNTTYTWVLESYKRPTIEAVVPLPYYAQLFRFHTPAGANYPYIMVQPENQAVAPGDNAVFTCEFKSPTAPISANWYKTTAPSTPITGTVTNLGGNLYRSTVTISNPQWTGQGTYYCTAVNSAGSTNSVGADLLLKVLVAHWNFEGDLDDVGAKLTGQTVYNGTPAVSATYVTSGGIDPNALQFDGTQYVDLPDGFDNFFAGMTVSVWARMDPNSGNWARYFDFASTGPDLSSFNFVRNSDSPNLVQFRGSRNAIFEGLAKGTWQHHVITVNPDGTAVLYLNGQEGVSTLGGIAGTTGVTQYAGIPAKITRDSNFFGKANPAADTTPLFRGLIGDIQMYNYVLTADEIATLYAQLNGPYCRTGIERDLNDDCKFDLKDFVIIAGQWMECGLWPACP